MFTVSVSVLFWLWVGTIVGFLGFAAAMIYAVFKQSEKINRESGNRGIMQQNINATLQTLTHRIDGTNTTIEEHDQLLDDHVSEFEHQLTAIRKELNARIDSVTQDLVKSVGQCEIASEKSLVQAKKELLEIFDKGLAGLQKDVDASLTQRTNTLTRYVDQSVQGAKLGKRGAADAPPQPSARPEGDVCCERHADCQPCDCAEKGDAAGYDWSKLAAELKDRIKVDDLLKPEGILKLVDLFRKK